MRPQRRPPVTVTLVQVRVTSDGVGNHSETTTRIVVTGAIFEPAQIVEGTGPDQAPVTQPAVFNLPGIYDVEGEDLVQVGAYPTEPDPDVAVGEWQVVGGGTVWLDRTKVPVTQVRSR